MKNLSTFNAKSLAISGILIGLGFILHSVVPPLFFGIKPDFLLACMFVSIAFTKDFKTMVATAVTCSIIAALTTNFPGGQIPSILDKTISAFFAFYMIKLISNNLNNTKKTIFFTITSFLGTLVSGAVFLLSVLFMLALPAPFMVLFTTIVLPTAILNAVIGFIMFTLMNNINKAK